MLIRTLQNVATLAQAYDRVPLLPDARKRPYVRSAKIPRCRSSLNASQLASDAASRPTAGLGIAPQSGCCALCC